MAAIALNLAGYTPGAVVSNTLMMGAYASMTMQLVLFGIYLYGVKIREINLLLTGWINLIKFLLLPIITYVVLRFAELDKMIEGVLFMELIMPLAVANVNLASLYNCRPRDTTVQVFITSLLFLGIVFVFVKVLDYI